VGRRYRPTVRTWTPASRGAAVDRREATAAAVGAKAGPWVPHLGWSVAAGYPADG
jgi:hypothetical protein